MAAKLIIIFGTVANLLVVPRGSKLINILILYTGGI